MIKRLLLLTLLLITTFIYADNNQYQVTVPVASQSQDDWQTGVNTALSQLLTQLTGSDKILSNKKIKSQLGQAASYVQSFTYVTSAGTNGQAQNQLQVQFYADTINQLLQSAGGEIVATPTPKDNSPTLVWLAVQDGQNKNLLNSNSKDELATTLQTSAKQNNFAFLMPMMDLQDMQEVTIDNVWQLDPSNLIIAAKRYGTQKILAAKIFNDNNQWQAQWVMVKGNQSSPGSAQGNSADDALTKMMAKISNSASSQAAAKNNAVGSNTVTLHISNVNGLDDYAAILAYLRGLSVVASADVANADPADLTITVQINGDAAALAETLNNDNKLAAIPTTDNDPNNLSYKWLNSTNTAAATNATPPTENTSATTDSTSNTY